MVGTLFECISRSTLIALRRGRKISNSFTPNYTFARAAAYYFL